MIYLAFDTDVWLTLITHGIDSEHNFFDEFCYWLERDEVCCIVPEHIITEWKRHKNAKIDKIKAELAAVIQIKSNTAIQNKELRSSVYSADAFEAFGRARIAKVEEIFEQSLKAPVTEAIKLEAGERTLQRLAPSHKKDSYSDTVNVLAVLEYIRNNPSSPVLFATNNYTDYSDKHDRAKVHPDLEPLFAETGLRYVYEVSTLFHKELRPNLSSFSAYLKQKKALDEGEQTLARQQEREQLANADEDFINNTRTIDFVLALARPTQVHYKMIRELIDIGEAYRTYFFEKVETPVWWTFFEEQGFLDPANHTGPVDTPQGSFTAYWRPLAYLERLSEKIKNGEYHEMISKVLAQVPKISAAPLRNDFTETAMIRIVSSMPNDAVTMEILQLLPEWFSKKSNKMFASSACCNLLLPKFINENAGQADTEKGEFILNYLFDISETGIVIDNTAEKADTSFHPNAYPPALVDGLIRKNLLPQIAKQCSAEVFYKFARTVKKLLLDYPRGLHFPVKQQNALFEVIIAIKLPDLHFSFTLPEGTEPFAASKLQNFEGLSRQELREAIIAVLAELGITYEATEENEDRLRGVIYALTIDKLSLAGSRAVSEMDIERSHSNHFRLTHGILLSKYLQAVTAVDSVKGAQMSIALFNDSQYQLPFFRRVVLHNIAENFETQRSIMRQVLSPDDPSQLFDDYVYRLELFSLLKSVQKKLNQQEIELLEAIIQTGPQDNADMDEGRKSYWQFRWYLALNQIEPFASRYKEIKASSDLKDRDGDPSQSFQLRSGTVPPMTVEALLVMDNDKLAAYLVRFNPKDRWEEPNISGLGEILKQAAEKAPKRFTDSLNLFLPLPYVLTYDLLNALLSLKGPAKLSLDWHAVLNFCAAYIGQDDFEAPERIREADGLHAEKHWVLSVIAELLSAFCSDDAAKDMALQSLARTILLSSAAHTVMADDDKLDDMYFMSHFYSSDNGKFLRACLDFCLCSKRWGNDPDAALDADFAPIFLRFIDARSFNMYTVIGRYWQRFNYLDHNWLMKFLNSLDSAPELNWRAFMGGFLFAAAPSGDILELMMPHYRRAVSEKLDFRISGTHGLAVHLASLYFWSLIDLSEGSALAQYIAEMPVRSLSDLLHIIFFSESYFAGLSDEKLLAAEDRIIALIDHIHTVYADSADRDVLEMRRSTVNLIYVIRELNASNTASLKKSITLEKEDHQGYDLFRPLRSLIDKGMKADTAGYLAAVMDEIIFVERLHLLPDDVKRLSALIQFLYDNNQKVSADRLCNRLSKAGQSFANDIYLNNNQ